jgi:hypothetical protein
MPQRAEVPPEIIERLRAVFELLPECTEEDAWVGLRWRIRNQTVAHVFGGEDQLIRVIFRAEPAEVSAFQHLGAPYFKTDWGDDHVGFLLDEATDWGEVAESITDAYCLAAPAYLVEQVARPG